MMKILNKLFKGNEQGFTLLEIIGAMGISSFIMLGMVISIYHIMVGGINVRENMMSTQFTQNTGTWFRQDLLASQALQMGDIPETPENEIITLFWTTASYKDIQDNECIDYVEVNYYLEGEELQRQKSVTTNVYNPNGGLIETTLNQGKAVISNNITSFNIISDNATLVLSVTSLVGDAETRQAYEVFPRALDR
jgi:hypothetical protein